MENKFKLYQSKALNAICGISLALTLSSCGGNVEENKIETTVSQEPIETTTDNQNLDTQEEKDSAAESAIKIMLEGAEKLEDSANGAANSEEVQRELDKSMQNFKDLSDFIFNGSEINGVTFNELSDSAKEKVLNAFASIDDILNYLVPNYKERFKDWFTDTSARGLDTLSDLKDKGLELWDEINSKRNTK